MVLCYADRERLCIDTKYFDPAVQVHALGRLTITLDPMPTKGETDVFKELDLSLTLTHT